MFRERRAAVLFAMLAFAVAIAAAWLAPAALLDTRIAARRPSAVSALDVVLAEALADAAE